MNSVGHYRRFLTFAAALLALASSAAAIDLEYVTPRLGVLYIRNGSGAGSASPIVNTLGTSLTFSLGEDRRLSIDPGIDLFWTYYEWDAALGRAVPTEPETAQAAFVLGGLLDCPFSWRFVLNKRISLKPGVGPAFVVRVPFPNSTELAAEDNSAIAGWFYTGGRFAYPEAQLLLDVELIDDFAFQLALRTFWPVPNLWTGDDFFDHFMFQAALSVRIRLGGAKPADASTEPPESGGSTETPPPETGPASDPSGGQPPAAE